MAMLPSGQEDMTPAGSFKDSWAWVRLFCWGGTAIALFQAMRSTGPDLREWLSYAGVLAGLYIGRAAVDGWSRRQTVVEYEKARIQAGAQAAPVGRGGDGAAG